MIHHSRIIRYPSDEKEQNRIVVGFHQTRHDYAYSIAREGFRPSTVGMLGPGIYFATSLNHIEFKANQLGTYMCAKIDLGKIKRVTE